MLTGRELRGEELERIWSIDLAEEITGHYRIEGGTLVLYLEPRSLDGWRPGTREKYAPILAECHARGRWFYGLFDGASLVGVVVLDNPPLGTARDQLQLRFLYVDRSYRNCKVGPALFEAARQEAARRAAAVRLGDPPARTRCVSAQNGAAI